MSDFLFDYAQYKFQPETEAIGTVLRYLSWSDECSARVKVTASELVERVRARPLAHGSLESFTQKFGLDTDEGVALMCLAEALLRIPDSRTVDAMIRDKVMLADWAAEGHDGDDWMANLAGASLSLSKTVLNGVLSRLGEPLIRKGLKQAMKMLGEQFVVGETIGAALANARVGHEALSQGSVCSFDMLGEGARTLKDAENYFESYWQSIEHVGAEKRPHGQEHGISVKLSALYPRYEFSRREECVAVLVSKMLELCRLASTFGTAITIDAEEMDRLDLSLEVLDQLSCHDSLAGWNGLGIAVQAYHKQAFHVIDVLFELARRDHRRIQVRLVKGAYWDSEIKHAQEQGFVDYPVFTRKAHSDLSYLACAEKLLHLRDRLYPMFATHNAHSVAAILDLERRDSVGMGGDYEFQRLYGMGQGLYEAVSDLHPDLKVRVYAPVGPYCDLLPYLVRRLLENGANSSFVNKLHDAQVDIGTIVADPVRDVMRSEGLPHPKLPLPKDIFGTGRVNSAGIDFSSYPVVEPLIEAICQDREPYEAGSYIYGQVRYRGDGRSVYSPADRQDLVGNVHDSRPEDIDKAFQCCKRGYQAWSRCPVEQRASILRLFSDLLEQNHEELMGLCVREAGKTVIDAHMEIREAVDFARYYAVRAERDMSNSGVQLAGVTGEENRLYWEGRGVFVCISPWNFPIAIFCGQVLAALVAGNSVIAKPAEQTSIIAARLTDLLYEAGVPKDAFALLLGDGEVGSNIVEHELVEGVAFTGSNVAAKSIQRALAAKDGAIVPLIAETGGLNAMLVDSSALAEQVVDDVIMSGFGGAGQRCSALRILCLQKEISGPVIEMLQGAMELIRVGDPADLSSDVGPVIDEDAMHMLQSHMVHIQGVGKVLKRVDMKSDGIQDGNYFAPSLVKIKSLSALEAEVFGPVIHVYEYEGRDRDNVVEQLNDLGYGLTFGVHSRIDSVLDKCTRESTCGNVYINRGMTGAVVGAQPFGGSGLSGTGPKAGGPFYLYGFAREKVVSDNIMASGGNVALINL